ncbi:hypothetical protein [Desulfocicer vacuolatum]|uniref:hypothetical protein n=1 Tax=Desulfocicer vacuolatum TaxID=2298 RepID=UPI001BAF322E|nr:hypothetical protein [Desulfocicer vacuolatum]
MKYSANRGCISIFVVVRSGAEYGPPVAVYIQGKPQSLPQQSPPRGAIGTGQLSCLQFRPGPLPLGGGAA